MKLLTTKVFTIIGFIFLYFTAAGKSINMDSYLSILYANKEYDKCYKLSKIVSSHNYSEYTLTPFNIKYKESNIYLSDSAKYYEYKSLKQYNLESFYYFYVIKNAEVSQYFPKNEVYPAFIKWVDSLYNSPINDGFDESMENLKSKKYKSIEDIPVIKAERIKNFKLAEIYNFLLKTDTVALNEIFKVDNKELIKIVKNRNAEDKNLLALSSYNFDIATCFIYSGAKTNNVQKEIRAYYNTLFKSKRFLNEEQIFNFLYSNTNFTDEEKMFVTFYFISDFLFYNKNNGKYTAYNDINKIILYRQTVCNGYAILLKHFLTKNNIKCYKVSLPTNKDLHANNIVILNNKVYYVDATWGVYYRDINTLPKEITITEWQLTPVKIDYTRIKNFSYIIEVVDYDIVVVDYFKTVLNKKGA